jgi:hypothetical protein
MELVELPNGVVMPPGVYNAIAELGFYDVNTNSRAMVDSELPVLLLVHETLSD